VFEGRIDLVGELVPVDAAAAAAGAGRVAGLEHEGRDDAVEEDGVVVTLFCEGGEIRAGFGCMVGVQLEGDGALGSSLVGFWGLRMRCRIPLSCRGLRRWPWYQSLLRDSSVSWSMHLSRIDLSRHGRIFYPALRGSVCQEDNNNLP